MVRPPGRRDHLQLLYCHVYCAGQYPSYLDLPEIGGPKFLAAMRKEVKNKTYAQVRAHVQVPLHVCVCLRVGVGGWAGGRQRGPPPAGAKIKASCPCKRPIEVRCPVVLVRAALTACAVAV